MKGWCEEQIFCSKRAFEGRDVKIESRDVKIEGRDAKIEGCDVKIGGRDVKIEGRDVKIEGCDVKIEGCDVKMEGCDAKIESRDDAEWTRPHPQPLSLQKGEGCLDVKCQIVKCLLIHIIRPHPRLLPLPFDCAQGDWERGA